MFRPFSKRQIPNPKLPGGPSAQPSIYWYTRQRQPGAGAMQYAFHTVWHLPYTSLIGAATQVQGLRSLPPPAVWVNRATVPIGLGGLVAGQMMLQPLLDPSNTSGVGE